MRTRGHIPHFQRTAGLVQGSKRNVNHITSEQRAEISVDRAGFARYSVYECRHKTEQEWYRRGHFTPLSLLRGTKACFSLRRIMHHYILVAAQIIVVAIAGILLWKIWHLLNKNTVLEDDPLTDEQIKHLDRHLSIIRICSIIAAVLAIAQAVLRFVEGL